MINSELFLSKPLVSLAVAAIIRKWQLQNSVAAKFAFATTKVDLQLQICLLQSRRDFSCDCKNAFYSYNMTSFSAANMHFTVAR